MKSSINRVQPSADVLVTDIQPTRGWVALRLGDVWAYRELLYFLAWRDIKVLYKQTVIGVLWVVLQPVITVLIFSVVFGLLLKVPSSDAPYPLFYFSAILPWTFFSGVLSRVSNSLVGNANLIKKVYFPRLVVPLAGVVASMLDFVIAFGVFLVFMLFYQRMPTADILWLPLLLLLAVITALGVGLWLSALNVQFRDVNYAVPFLIQIWFYATPVIYSSDIFGRWQPLVALNPMAGVIEGFRWALLGTGNAPGPLVAISALVSVILLISGLYYFRRTERTFADVV